MNRTIIIAALGIPMVLLSGCRRDELTGPPELRLGRDECAECGMLVNEDRFSSAMLIERDGVREHLMFDDAGCMIDYEAQHPGEFTVIERFVHDHPTREWVSASKATFIFAEREKLRTPMGSGIGAFASEDAAREAHAQFGGEILSYDRLVPVRIEWMQIRVPEPGQR